MTLLVSITLEQKNLLVLETWREPGFAAKKWPARGGPEEEFS